jgi:hypothetical protein
VGARPDNGLVSSKSLQKELDLSPPNSGLFFAFAKAVGTPGVRHRTEQPPACAENQLFVALIRNVQPRKEPAQHAYISGPYDVQGQVNAGRQN